MKHVESATSSGAVLTGEFIISNVILVGGTANSRVILDDSTDGSGTAQIDLKSLANSSESVDLGKGINFETGVYATLTGTGAKVYVYYR